MYGLEQALATPLRWSHEHRRQGASYAGTRTTSTGTPTTSRTGSPRDGRDGYPVEPGRYRLSSPGPARGRTARSSCGGCSGSRTCSRMGVCGPTHDERSWTFDLDPGRRRPGAGHRAAAAGASSPASPTTRAASRCPRSSTSPPARSSPTTIPQMTLDLSTEWTRVPPRRARPTCTRRRCATRSTRSSTSSSGTSTTASTAAASPARQEAYDKAYDRLFARLDWLSDRLPHAALPGRRHHHRGRRPAVHHAGPLRRRLPRPLQVQPQQAHRDAGAVGLRAGPVPDARVRRHHRLRADQAALLRGAHRHQPDADRAQGPGPAELARPRTAARQLGGRPFGDGTPPPPPKPAEAVPPLA